MEELGDYQGITCDVPTLTCEINGATVSDSTGSRNKTLIQKTIEDNVNNNKTYLQANPYYDINSGKMVGTQFNSFLTADNSTCKGAIQTIIENEPDEDYFDNELVNKMANGAEEFYGAIKAMGSAFLNCDMFFVWEGQIYVSPDKSSTNYKEKTKFNLKDDFNVRFRNIHDPKDANGYSTEVEDYYFDKAAVLAGLDDKSCLALRDAKVEIPDKVSSMGTIRALAR